METWSGAGWDLPAEMDLVSVLSRRLRGARAWFPWLCEDGCFSVSHGTQCSWISKHQEALEKPLLTQGGSSQPWLDVRIIRETKSQMPLHADVLMN